MASVAHNTLAKIISNILRDLYSIRAPSLAARVPLTAKHSLALINWRKRLSRFLDADGIDTSLLIPLFQRQRNVLNLAYYHALILVHRPFLLSNFASLSSRNERSRGAPGTADMDKSVSDCLDAAMSIAGIVDELMQGNQLYRAFWVSCEGTKYSHLTSLTHKVYSILRILRRGRIVRLYDSTTPCSGRQI